MQTLILNGEKCMIHFVPASRFSFLCMHPKHTVTLALSPHSPHAERKPMTFQCRV